MLPGWFLIARCGLPRHAFALIDRYQAADDGTLSAVCIKVSDGAMGTLPAFTPKVIGSPTYAIVRLSRSRLPALNVIYNLFDTDCIASINKRAATVITRASQNLLLRQYSFLIQMVGAGPTFGGLMMPHSRHYTIAKDVLAFSRTEQASAWMDASPPAGRAVRKLKNNQPLARSIHRPAK